MCVTPQLVSAPLNPLIPVVPLADTERRARARERQMSVGGNNPEKCPAG